MNQLLEYQLMINDEMRRLNLYTETKPMIFVNSTNNLNENSVEICFDNSNDKKYNRFVIEM